MSRIKIIAAGVAGLILSACGGGGGGTGGTTTSPQPTPGVFSRKASTVGDFLTQKAVSVTKFNDANPQTLNYYFTEFVTEQNSSFSKTTSTDSLPGSTSTSSTFDENGKQTILSFNDGCSNNYLPAYERFLPASVRLDTTWDANITRNYSCINSNDKGTDQLALKGKVLGQETVTVAAGTFSTIKYSSTLTRTRPTSTLVTERTCWADPDSGINVKCTTVTTSTVPATPENGYVTTTTTELASFSHAATQRKKLSVERFAGDWAGVYKGDDHGYCTFTVDLTGSLQGSCQSNGFGGTFALRGTIDANGNLSFILSSDGVSTPSFKGTLDSPGYMAGTWLLSGGGGGTWFMQHQ